MVVSVEVPGNVLGAPLVIESGDTLLRPVALVVPRQFMSVFFQSLYKGFL